MFSGLGDLEDSGWFPRGRGWVMAWLGVYDITELGGAYDITELGGIYDITELGGIYDITELGGVYDITELGCITGRSLSAWAAPSGR
jgi:hypothetical protein